MICSFVAVRASQLLARPFAWAAVLEALLVRRWSRFGTDRLEHSQPVFECSLLNLFHLLRLKH